MACETCTEYSIPDCLETLYIDGFFDVGIEYVVTFTNHLGKKSILNLTANYVGLLEIDINEDLGEGYFFPGNTYVFEAFEGDDDLICDNPMHLCGYNTCLSIEVYKAAGQLTEYTLTCCE